MNIQFYLLDSVVQVFLLDPVVDFYSVDRDRAQWAGWTEMFAGSAAYALLFDDGRYHEAVRILRVGPDHRDGSDRAVPCAVAAADRFAVDDTEVQVDAGCTDLHACLFLRSDRKYGSGRTDLRASDAFRTAVALGIEHLRLHQMCEVRRRPKHIVRTDRDAELAGSAPVVELLHAL